MNYLALDVGTRKIGMAVGSLYIQKANPLPLSSDPQYHVRDILKQVKDWQVRHIIVGDPGQREENQKLIEYIALLKEQIQKNAPYSIHIEDWTEQGSSQEARQIQKSCKKIKDSTDSLAAALILESYFYNRSF